MPLQPIFEQLTPRDIPIQNLKLDPNNPRFTGPDFVRVSITDISSDAVQEETRRKMVAYFDVDRLRANMEVNGFLPIDRVIVQSIDDTNYVILEGNRRICAAQLISPLSKEGETISEEVQNSTRVIPCLVYTGTDTNAAWIFQGLRHIAGVMDWSAYNKAKLLVEQTEEEGLTIKEAGKRFGLSVFGANQWVRGYKAFLQTKETDYASVVNQSLYPYMQELFGRSSAKLREWLGWNEEDGCFTEELRLDEFLSWLYPEFSDGSEGGTVQKDWSKRRIPTRDGLREISEMIKNGPEFFQRFRDGTELQHAYSAMVQKELEERSQSEPTKQIYAVVESCTKSLQNIPHKMLKDAEAKRVLFEHLDRLDEAILFVRE